MRSRCKALSILAYPTGLLNLQSWQVHEKYCDIYVVYVLVMFHYMFKAEFVT